MFAQKSLLLVKLGKQLWPDWKKGETVTHKYNLERQTHTHRRRQNNQKTATNNSGFKKIATVHSFLLSFSVLSTYRWSLQLGERVIFLLSFLLFCWRGKQGNSEVCRWWAARATGQHSWWQQVTGCCIATADVPLQVELVKWSAYQQERAREAKGNELQWEWMWCRVLPDCLRVIFRDKIKSATGWSLGSHQRIRGIAWTLARYRGVHI